ncbi:hypothetical protein TWF696_006588 [Orbilia brochopaga]|uniref:tRNA wybutosine-synthesizing protein 3 n=1 Tax=Orbilia brochopaga TaxID=3140254 RepID=A0AAV9UWR7_9PEZI
MNHEKRRQEFKAKKSKILSDLASDEPDASPKGSVDTHILSLIELLNQHDGIVTTSSCSGRISVFLEGRKEAQDASKSCDPDSAEEPLDNLAAIGGKGGGGRWLLVAHDPLSESLLAGDADADDSAFLRLIFNGISSQQSPESIVSPSKETRYIHFKFEPMILHVLTEDLDIANKLLVCATAGSFRESGIVNPLRNPVVAIRTTGLAFDAPIGLYDSATGTINRFIEPPALRNLVRLANDRFQENFRRIAALYAHIDRIFATPAIDVESKQERAKRKRLEGLARQKEKLISKEKPSVQSQDPLGDGILF